MLVNCTLKVVVVLDTCAGPRVKVKFSHTRYRALGPELISVYRQSACRMSEWPESTHIHYALVSVGAVECMSHALQRPSRVVCT